MTKKSKLDNVFETLGFDSTEAINLKMRADLMIALRAHISKENWTQANAAKQLGIDQPQVSRLINGKIDTFTVDKLLVLAARANISVTWTIAA